MGVHVLEYWMLRKCILPYFVLLDSLTTILQGIKEMLIGFKCVFLSSILGINTGLYHSNVEFLNLIGQKGIG